MNLSPIEKLSVRYIGLKKSEQYSEARKVFVIIYKECQNTACVLDKNLFSIISTVPDREDNLPTLIGLRTCADCGVDISYKGKTNLFCEIHKIEKCKEARSRADKRRRWKLKNMRYVRNQT